MAWQVKHLADDGVVMVLVSGEINLEALLATFLAGATKARELSVKRILIDARGMTLASSTTELYGLPGLLQEQGLTRAHKVAIVFSGELEPDKDLLFLETVFFNRGFPLRLFPEKNEAIAWLKRTRGSVGTKDQPKPDA